MNLKHETNAPTNGVYGLEAGHIVELSVQVFLLTQMQLAGLLEWAVIVFVDYFDQSD